ncbi:hypothetical protein BGZ80_001497 [Entomortierella chlamydospora]|uniref:Uncharacterized protein n=1 Tax=Entomortierella chlamydospora TaxID=101097 RepID=A0A9P6SXX7_9FUNG|nr:hypothetical protein BGZ80_001497 [Entomortierella chlamydospora]
MSLNDQQKADAAAVMPLLLQDEKELQFSRFTNDDALTLGNIIVHLAKERVPYKGISILITRNGQVLFQHSMEGTTVDNEDWLRRKNNTVIRLQHSSYYIGRELASKGLTDMEKTYRVSMNDYACHGGGFPLLIKDVGCVGAIVVSGLKQGEDHLLVTQGIRELITKMEQQQQQQ